MVFTARSGIFSNLKKMDDEIIDDQNSQISSASQGIYVLKHEI